MPIFAAFVLVVLIWSTTPLGIVWSSETIRPTLSLLLRMTLAILVGLPLLRLLNIKLDWRPKAIKVYLYSSMSLAMGMLFCYLAAAYISSGLMSLTFGMAPILSGIFATKILNEPKFSNVKKLALAISFVGLFIVSQENISLGEHTWLGMCFVFAAVILFSLSSVLVKSVGIQLHPLSTTVGSLMVSWPLFLLFWLVVDGRIDYSSWEMRSVLTTGYLAIFGSLVGFWAYFYMLKQLPASTVSLVVMITPILATGIGIWANDEFFSLTLLFGGALVVFGLGLFQLGHKLFKPMEKLPEITN